MISQAIPLLAANQTKGQELDFIGGTGIN